MLAFGIVVGFHVGIVVSFNDGLVVGFHSINDGSVKGCFQWEDVGLMELQRQ